MEADGGDESLKKYKEQLLGAAAKGKVGSGERFGLQDGTTSCGEEKSQITSWITEKGTSSFISRYTAELHKSYYINKFLPTVLALASKRTEQEVMDVFNDADFQTRLSNARDKFEESELLGDLWKRLV